MFFALPLHANADTSDCAPIPIAGSTNVCEGTNIECGFSVPIGRGNLSPMCCPSRADCDLKEEELAARGNITRPKNTVCSYTGDSAECTACLGDGGEGGGVWTALGCIHYGQDAFTLELVKIIIGIASLISLAMMLIGAVLYMTGGGNTEQLKRGKELFTGALVGLLFLIFSVVILQIITRDIIQIDIGM